MIFSSKASIINTKISAFRCTPVCSAKAYMNQDLAVPNAMFSDRMYSTECQYEWKGN